jgi:hypothetical protein
MKHRSGARFAYRALIFEQAGSRFQQHRHEHEGKKLSEMPRFLQFLIRYAAAIGVACTVSFLTALFGIILVAVLVPYNFLPKYANALDSIFNFVVYAPVGFIGVLLGTFCLERSGRRYGSVVLLGLGLGFSTWLWLAQGYSLYPAQFRELSYRFWPLGVGGLVAVIFFWFKSRKRIKTQQK